jgi:hypothetical protein
MVLVSMEMCLLVAHDNTDAQSKVKIILREG